MMDIIQLLKEKHAGMPFAAEVNTGSKWKGCARLDAWAMYNTWCPVRTVGYEVKCSRGDWMRDTKWTGYAPFVNELVLVSEPGIVKASEIPAGCGWMEASRNGRRLVTRIKPVWREIEDDRLLLYLLMSRATLDRREDRAGYFRELLERKQDNLLLGRVVGRRIREEISRRVDAANAENNRLRNELSALVDVRDFCEKNKINFLDGWSRHTDLRRLLPPSLSMLGARLREALDEVSRLQKQVDA